jgi:hypothetical protein
VVGFFLCPLPALWPSSIPAPCALPPWPLQAERDGLHIEQEEKVREYLALRWVRGSHDLIMFIMLIVLDSVNRVDDADDVLILLTKKRAGACCAEL